MMNWEKYRVLLNSVCSVLLLFAAYLISSLLLPFTGSENNSALVFVLAVVVISLLTEGYVYGILASVVSTFCINYFFMVPYVKFNITSTGYPVAMVSMLAIALIVCTLTSRSKENARMAVERERKTKELYEINSKLEKEKAAMELEAAKSGVRSNLLMSVSHDLRTPLTAISGSASVILSQGTSGCSKENLKLVKDIKEDAEWLTVMVENILSVTKLRDSGTTLTVKPEILDEVLGSSILKTKRRFPDCQVDLILSDEVLLVPMDSLLCQQVILNLLENAIRHSGVRTPIEMRVSREENRALISIQDYGKGLPEDILQQIANQTPVMVDRRGDSYRGMGIGLAVCQSILQAHGSRLCAENMEEGGARFYFYLDLDGEENIYGDKEEDSDC